MRKYRNVALLVDTTRETGRGILQGVIRYNREHGPWTTYFQPHGIGHAPPKWLSGWKGDGILARINSPRAARVLKNTGLPVIDVRAATVVSEIPRLEVDNHAMADMVVTYLLDRGLRRFAFCGYPRGVHQLYDERCQAFVDRVEQAGFPCAVYCPSAKMAQTLPRDAELLQIEKWIGGLKGHVGIMACNDDLGRVVLDACLRVGRQVPDEIAVIGVENDPPLCNLYTPPLTSVDVNAERLGYYACGLLEKLIRKQKAPGCTRLPPLRIVERQSTDVLAIDDPDLVAAIRYIRKHACLEMKVADLNRLLPVSRSSLNRRFQLTLGRSPKEEIAKVQLDRACELLAESDLSIHEIAQSCGFSNSNYFSKWFHEQLGKSPRKFRLQVSR